MTEPLRVYEKLKITNKGEISMDQFANLGLSPSMVRALAKKGFKEPTPIQDAVIPFILHNDSDVVAQADTGTGKTAAFGIPIIEQLATRSQNVQALILVPTRELALQVAGEMNSFSDSKNLKIAAIYGGQDFGLQRRALKKGVDIVVGTPGRLLDHLRRGTLYLKEVSFVVLDEADQMLDMGFIEDIESILSHVPSERRTLLFSATMPKAVISIARRYMGNYETIAMKAAPQAKQLTDQIYIEVREQDKLEALCRVIDIDPYFYGLVFCRTRTDTTNIAEKLIRRGYKADAINGDITQPQREKIMDRFRRKDINILVATDVAARGIDINDLTHVINYAMPQDPDSYTHRIGRTGRAGKNGSAITFVCPSESRRFDIIRKNAGASLHRGRIPGVNEIISAKSARIGSEIEKVMNKGDDFGAYYDLATDLLMNGDARDVLAACLKHAFADELDTSAYKEIRKLKQYNSKTPNQRLFVAKGRRHGITPKKMAKFIHMQTGVKERLVSDIKIFDEFSYISVPSAEANLIQKSFRQKRGRPLISKAKPEQRRRAAG